MLHIYYGMGKGKTTAAIGLAVRMLGHERTVVFCQFLKDRKSGEAVFLSELSDVTYLTSGTLGGFTWQLNEEQLEALRKRCSDTLQKAVSTAKRNRAALLVLDESLRALRSGVLDEEELFSAVDEIRGTMEVVLTGHDVPSRFLEIADYVTQMKNEKHPLEHGISAREGVEY